MPKPRSVSRAEAAIKRFAAVKFSADRTFRNLNGKQQKNLEEMLQALVFGTRLAMAAKSKTKAELMVDAEKLYDADLFGTQLEVFRQTELIAKDIVSLVESVVARMMCALSAAYEAQETMKRRRAA